MKKWILLLLIIPINSHSLQVIDDPCVFEQQLIYQLLEYRDTIPQQEFMKLMLTTFKPRSIAQLNEVKRIIRDFYRTDAAGEYYRKSQHKEFFLRYELNRCNVLGY